MGAAKVRKANAKSIKMQIFFGFAEVPPNLGAAKVRKANAKSIKMQIFFGFAEVPPNLGMPIATKKAASRIGNVCSCRSVAIYSLQM